MSEPYERHLELAQDRRDQVLGEWTCEGQSAIDDPTCTVCGHPLAEHSRTVALCRVTGCPCNGDPSPAHWSAEDHLDALREAAQGGHVGRWITVEESDAAAAVLDAEVVALDVVEGSYDHDHTAGGCAVCAGESWDGEPDPDEQRGLAIDDDLLDHHESRTIEDVDVAGGLL